MQKLKVDQVSFKWIIKYFGDVDGTSKIQVLFIEKTEQLYIFRNP